MISYIYTFPKDAGIYADASYEVKSIYIQSFDDDTQLIIKKQLNSLDDCDTNSDQSKVYMTLYNPQYHTDGSPVVVTPEEVGLITVREEIGNAAWLAVPGKSALVLFHDVNSCVPYEVFKIGCLAFLYFHLIAFAGRMH